MGLKFIKYILRVLAGKGIYNLNAISYIKKGIKFQDKKFQAETPSKFSKKKTR